MADSSYIRQLKAGLRSRLAGVERKLGEFDELVAERHALRRDASGAG